MATQVEKYNIEDGPSKWDLMLGLFDNLSNGRTVRFNLDREAGPGTSYIAVCLNAVSREDGSGNSFCFEGYIPNKFGGHVKGWMTTTKRKGWLEITTELS